MGVPEQEKGERRQCRFCRDPRMTRIYQHNAWEVARCRQCGHYTTVPWPTDHDLQSAYDAGYFQDYGMWSPDATEQQRLVAAYGRRVRRIEDFAQPPGRLVEVGAGTGLLVVAALERGWDAVGYDTSEDAIEAGGTRLGERLRLGTIEEAASREQQVDVLAAYHVLEHTPNPREFVHLAYTMLKPGGILAVEVPHVLAFDTRWLPSVRRLVLDVPRHLCHFTPRTLTGLLRETGFRIAQVDGSTTILYHRLRGGRIEQAASDRRPDLAVSPAPYRAGLLRSVARRWFSGYAFGVYAQRPPDAR
jgi:2-polyprenyl-3-methyl-5-hydroxy-6-metoxy-1,4-benzoquinol methylase